MKIRLSKILPYLILGVSGLIILIYGVRTHSESWYFQDENEHLTPAWMMNNQGSVLYRDLSTNHQPLPIIVSRLLVKLVPFNTLFELIDRFRIVMFLGLIGICAVLVWQVRSAGLLTGLIMMSMSYYYLGWHVLAESLTAGTVALLILLLLQQWWPDAKPRPVSLIKVILFGIGVFWTVFNLLSLWPFAAVIVGIYGWKLNPKQRMVLLSSLVIPTLLLFLIIPPVDWFRETITNVWLYFLPEKSLSGWLSPLAFLSYPLLHLGALQSVIGRFFLLSSGILLMSGCWLVVNKRLALKRDWPKLVLIWIVITLLNNRVDQAQAAFYEGFHLWPYVAGWSALVSFVAVQAIEFMSSLAKKRWLLLGLFALIIVNNIVWLTERPDKLSEYYINYDPYQSTANAIRAIKEPGETLLTGPDGAGLVNILAEVSLADRQNFHLPWSWRSPQLQAEFKQMMNERPPTYVYFQVKDNGYYNYMKPILDAEYLPLLRPDGAESLLLVRKDKLNRLNDQQIKSLAEQSFSFATQ